jgi:D-glycero-beta-D-manno-heptose 1-phosphate adenylyltransferase
MFSNGRLFGSDNVLERYVPDYEKLGSRIKHLKGLDARIVLTSGTFDILHVGHQRYLHAAKRHGDILVVGVDSDEKVRNRKGPDRPIVPETERIEVLAHQRSVDIITLKPLMAEKWALIKLVRPDVLIATQETYKNEERELLKEWCGEVVVLEPQAMTSTTAKIRRLHIGGSQELAEKIKRVVEEHLASGGGR